MGLSNYNELVLWVSLAFCLSLTAGGILVIFRIEQTGRSVALRYLQYFLILLYVFGYYSLWSKILISRFVDVENIARLTTIISQMGVPFFILGLMMQLIWAINTQSRPSKVIFPVTIAVGIVVVLVSVQLDWPVVDTVRAAASLAGFVVSMAVISIFMVGKTVVLQRKWTNRLIALLAAAGLIQLTYFTEMVRHEYYETVFVFLFFLFNTATVVLFAYTAKVGQTSQSFAEFVLNYNITKREADVIQGIYAGKTNQEIADQLFITLQTVKDHSSRIYQKTQVKNRTQLAALLRESQNFTDEKKLFDEPR